MLLKNALQGIVMCAASSSVLTSDYNSLVTVFLLDHEQSSLSALALGVEAVQCPER